MKGLNFFDKFVFVLNSISAVLLAISYLLPHVPPAKFSFISILSLTVPFLIILNVCFLIYWLIRLKKQVLLSLLVLLLGYNYATSLYQFGGDDETISKEGLKVMTYNVRLFNVFNWLPDANIKDEISSFIKTENPDVLCMQEYRPNTSLSLKGYSKYEELSGEKIKTGQAIYSRYPIVNSGSIEFPNTANNAIFADIVKGEDTVRIYNLHLQSLRIDTANQPITEENSENLVRRVALAFRQQQNQMELFLKHKDSSKHPLIICGDFNNTAYSYVYRNIREGLNDAFVEAGIGFGRTFKFDLFPMRIDFILTDPDFEVENFKSYKEEFSDHYPISTSIKL